MLHSPKSISLNAVRRQFGRIPSAAAAGSRVPAAPSVWVATKVSVRMASTNHNTPVQNVRTPEDLASGKRELATVRSSAAVHDSPGKEKVVILGSGWGGYTFSRQVSPKQFSPVVISPRTYFVFTPLLTDACGGSVDFSIITEPVRDRWCKADYIQAAARSIDFNRKTVLCESTVVHKDISETPRMFLERTDQENEEALNAALADQKKWNKGDIFEIPYDKLVISVGAVARTFKTPGVRENAMFFKDVGDARQVKRRVQECFELAALPTTSPEMRKYLMTFAIVGAGPTGTELAGSLRDFIHGDMIRLYPSLQGLPHIVLYDVAPKVLSMFDDSLSQYAMETMRKEGITILTSHHVKNLRWGAPHEPGPHEMDPRRCLTLETAEEGEVGVGVCVWVTGNAQRMLIRESMTGLEKFPVDSAIVRESESTPSTATEAAQDGTWHVRKSPRGGALLVDNHLRVQLENDKGQVAVMQDVFAFGDNSMLEVNPVPATAQATRQEAKWLATRFNKGDINTSPPFSFENMGVLAYLGDQQALMQLPKEEAQKHSFLPSYLKGKAAWIVWNSAYVGMSISWKNKLRLVFRWFVNNLFGRDVSRF